MNIDIIKRAAVEAIDASNPCKIVYGTVTKTDPIEVKVSDSLILTKPFLVVDSAVEVGEKVVLIRHQGGQKYLILSTRVKYDDQTTSSTKYIGGTDESGGTSIADTGNWKSLGRFKITHYCAEKYPHICNAGAPYKTALGTDVRAGICAVDPRRIKLRSYVKINGQVYHAEDTGGAIKGNRIDIAVKTHAEAMRKGVIYAEVFLKV